MSRPFVPSVDLDALGSRTTRSLRGGFTPRSPTLYPPFESPSPRSPLASSGANCVASAAVHPFKFLPDFFPSNPASPIDATDNGGSGAAAADAGDMVDQMLSSEDSTTTMRLRGGAGPGWATSPSSASAAAAASPFVPSPSFGSAPFNRAAAPRSRFAAVGASSFGESTHHTPSSSIGSSSGLNARRDRRAMFDEDGDLSPFVPSSSSLSCSDNTSSPGAPQMVSRRLSGPSARSSVAASPALSSYSAAPSSTSSRHSSLRFGSPLSSNAGTQSPAAAMRSLTLRER